jgi:para-nitrobenzyl esterase
MASPLARGLFRRAIGQSGGLFEPLEAAPEFSLAGAEQLGAALARRLGAPTLAALRALPADEVLAQRHSPQAVIDGVFLLETPYATFARQRQHAVDILVGSNSHEGLYFAAGREIGAATFADELRRDFPPFLVALAGPAAPANDAAARAAFVEFEGEMRFGWNMWTWARLHARSGAGRTFSYRFVHAPPGETGATHGAEMAYVFGHLDPRRRDWREQDWHIARVMASYWANFARTGDPNGAGLPSWPAFTTGNETVLVIGDGMSTSLMPGPGSILAIDRVYRGVRFLMAYGLAIAGAAALLVLALVGRFAARRFGRAPRRTVAGS